jgi:hypothetical protein
MKKILIAAALTVSVASLWADESHGFQASLTPDIAIYPKTTEINGLSLNIWGENPQHGVAIGFVNGSTGDSSGFTWGIVDYSESYTGVSWSVVDVNSTSFHGWQAGIVNVAQGEFVGFQSCWLVNYAKEMHGLQLGLVNYTENLHGVQVGLANIAMNNPWFSDFPDKLATGFPIVNWSF